MYTVFMSLIRKHSHGRYTQKDLPMRIIGLPAVITLLEEGKKVQAGQTWWKITLVKVTAQSRKGYMAISKQSEAHYSTDRKVIQTWKKCCVQFSQERTSQYIHPEVRPCTAQTARTSVITSKLNHDGALTLFSMYCLNGWEILFYVEELVIIWVKMRCCSSVIYLMAHLNHI